MKDPYLDLIDENWNNIAKLYDIFRDKEQIIEYEVESKKIYSYPAKEYINALGDRTRNATKIRFKEISNDNQFMLFIKDKRNKKLRSYIFDVP